MPATRLSPVDCDRRKDHLAAMDNLDQSRDPKTHGQRRFSRQLSRLQRVNPRFGAAVQAVTAPGRQFLRIPLAILLMLGGFVGFLPIVGFWMLPLGLILLAIDVPGLRPAVAALTLRIRVFLRRFQR